MGERGGKRQYAIVLTMRVITLFMVSWCFIGCAYAQMSASPSSSMAIPVITPIVPPVFKRKISKSSYLFPYDLSQWLCGPLIREIKANGTWWRLQKLLIQRPHQFHAQVALARLKPMPLKFAPKQRNRETYYYHMLHESVLDDLIALLEAAKHAGYDLRVQSAFRSVDRQNLLWQSALRKHKFKYEKAAFRVAPPCYSEHATGMAVDFSLSSIHRKVQRHPVYAWLQQHAADYGWAQSFVDGQPGVSRRQKKPGVMPEAWHFRHRLLLP